MENYIYYSYLTASVAYVTLFVFVVFNKNRHYPFIIAVLCSAIWSTSVTFATKSSHYFYADTLAHETIRNGAWFFLLAALLSKQRYNNYKQLFKGHTSIAITTFVLIILCLESFPESLKLVTSVIDADPRFAGHVVFAVLGLILVEQLYRSTPLKQRWNLKFLCISLGAVFAVDLLVYSKSLLFNHLDFALWQSRGVTNAMITPFLAITATRLKLNSDGQDLTTPRKTIFYTTILFGCGVYLILMSFAGFYIKRANTEWGETAQAVFIFLALLLLVVPFTSGKIRALVKVYFSKHFFHYSYDYREEWLKISKALAKLESLEELKGFIINTLTDLVESTGGGLWLKNDQGRFFLAAEQNLRLTAQEIDYLHNVGDLPLYLANKQWVIDFFELSHAPEVYDDIDLSPWCYEDSQVWLIVPLFHLNKLEAFVVLTQARVPRKLNWEDHDLLKTVGMQLANALALNRASEELANNRQFETYHRLSAFLVHDLKNLVAQISLIVRNAEKHKHNPDFFDDTIDTLNNVVKKMHHIVEQLKQGEPQAAANSVVNLAAIARSIAQQHLGSPPVTLDTDLDECPVSADKIKLTNILTNLVQNAQDATRNSSGWVKLELTKNQDYAQIKIMDNGVGMDQQFIAERLFKPFDTTKGNAGMGIGAYEARDYITKNAGQIHVDSKPGQGTTFTIKLPLAKLISDKPRIQ
ncbi:XrtA/PEP-CTERM system histidine kinase PrsK [Methylomonas koyamae]|uniref:XrtA/PEP-CTERM system histidine kinase PrsK n=1 Tax=Methylomonas koyamae TaxID=702114 RepID=UPI002873C4E3|nr:XrtA/PEP-CTERM system histidine kinase PrsK [Methylomonas koyamae]WNB77208.1 PEP-CTERM system histidine kinase PrsK [Methylomonas koyamae]